MVAGSARRYNPGVRPTAAVLAAWALLLAAPAAGEPPPERDWEFAATPYIWLPAMTGSVTVRGREAEVDTDVADLFTETDLILAVQLELEAWYRQRFGLLLNGQWTRLDQDDNLLGPTQGPPFGPGIFPIQFDLTTNLGLLEVLGAWRAGTWELGSGAGSPALTVEPFAGARLTSLKITFDPNGGSDLDRRRTWADPILGARATLALGHERRWKLHFRGDFGGFGAGSEFTWNLVGGVGYEWRPKLCRVEAILGARALYQDYQDGSGTGRFEWDITQYGPAIGLALRF